MSVIVLGEITIVNNEEKLKGIKSILYKYSPDFIESGMIYWKSFDKIHVLKINIKRNNCQR